MKHIAITGAAGFIGSNIVENLNSFGIDNIVLVDSYNAFAKTWEVSLKNAKYLSILEPNSFLDKFNNYDYSLIIHAGATLYNSKHADSIYFKNNYDYSIELLTKFEEICKNSYFINLSTSLIYGNQNRPSNLYSMSKKMVDDYIERNFEKLNKHIVSFRLFDVFGKDEYYKKENASLIFKLFKEIKTNNTLTLYNTGNYLRDFIYVKDVVNNILGYFDCIELPNATTVKESKYPILDLGSGNPVTINKIVEYIKLYFNNIYLTPNYIPIPDQIKKSFRDFSSAKFKEDWKPILKYSLQDALFNYFADLENNEIV